MATKLTLAQRARKDPALLKRVLANPGLRSKLPASMLTPELRQQRATNTRLAQPIVPGSTETERDLARDTTAAMDTKYGPLEATQKQTQAQEVQRGTDIGNWYDEYLKRIQQHAATVQSIGQAAGTLGQNLLGGISGLGQQGLAGVQQPANADATARGASAGNMAPVADAATAIRQALVGSFVAAQNAQNTADTTYADTQANVIAPGQGLGAKLAQGRVVKQAGQAIQDTARQRGADSAAYKSDARKNERNFVLAEQTAGIKDSAAKTAAADKKANSYGPGGNKPNEWGFTYDEWNKLTPKARDDWRSGKKTRAPKAPGSDPVYTSGAFNGMKHSEVDALSPEARQKAVDKYNKQQAAGGKKKPGATAPGLSEEEAADFQRKYGVAPATGTKLSNAISEVGRARDRAVGLIKSNPGMTRAQLAAALMTSQSTSKPGQKTDKHGKPIPGQTDKNKRTTSGWKAVDALFVAVALDLATGDKVITNGTAARLHRAGYAVKSLGLPSEANRPTTTTKPTYNPGGSLGGFPKK